MESKLATVVEIDGVKRVVWYGDADRPWNRANHRWLEQYERDHEVPELDISKLHIKL